MSECESCKNKANYPCPNSCGYMGACDGYEPKPLTRADRIRAMTDKELAEFLDRWEMGDIDYSKTFCDLCEGQYDCHDDCLLDWLKEASDGTEAE